MCLETLQILLPEVAHIFCEFQDPNLETVSQFYTHLNRHLLVLLSPPALAGTASVDPLIAFARLCSPSMLAKASGVSTCVQMISHPSHEEHPICSGGLLRSGRYL